eukprot:1791771-Prymnesium_polylepis.1
MKIPGAARAARLGAVAATIAATPDSFMSCSCMKTAVMGFCWCDLTILITILTAFARPGMPFTFLEIYLGPGFGSIPSS